MHDKRAFPSLTKQHIPFSKAGKALSLFSEITTMLEVYFFLFLTHTSTEKPRQQQECAEEHTGTAGGEGQAAAGYLSSSGVTSAALGDKPLHPGFSRALLPPPRHHFSSTGYHFLPQNMTCGKLIN